jgi:hypothetical protein
MKLTAVVQELKKERDRAQSKVEGLDAASRALGSLDGTGGISRRRRGHFSAATRAKMAAAQRARWSRVRGTRATSSKVPIPIRAKRRLSAAGLAGIRAAQKMRWAKWKQRQKGKVA